MHFCLTIRAECRMLVLSSLKEQALRSLPSENQFKRHDSSPRLGCYLGAGFDDLRILPGNRGKVRGSGFLWPLCGRVAIPVAVLCLRTAVKAYFTRCADGCRTLSQCERANVEISRRQPRVVLETAASPVTALGRSFNVLLPNTVTQQVEECYRAIRPRGWCRRGRIPPQAAEKTSAQRKGQSSSGEQSGLGKRISLPLCSFEKQ